MATYTSLGRTNHFAVKDLDAFRALISDSGIELELGVWIADPAQGTGPLRSDINLAVWRGFRAAGIEIPYPQREVRVVTEAGGKVIS